MTQRVILGGWWDEYWNTFSWDNWKAGWGYMYRSASETLSAAITKEPEKYRPPTEAHLQEMAKARANLDWMRARVPDPKTDADLAKLSPEDQQAVKNYRSLEQRYADLWAGVMKDAEVAQQSKPQLGVAPLLIVAGLAMGAGSIAWCVQSYEYAVGLREQTDLQKKELEARYALAQQGKSLPPSTLPQQANEKPQSPTKDLSDLVGQLGYVAGLAGVIGLAWMVVPRIMAARRGAQS